ncbi:bifunctional aminoglycoside phosphotransferase/ATP-binding protein [Falsiroseomonas selenitidurans]|uniref:AAA family ATPase n=1 Tax=Falsiroseomonas selenitidurans TaxID=2716335 RepID=A0ABX1DY17_9PROT|nr:AAA family ATPase [Falsiroseomonas selenitidurans]NKC29795.1 AAA family ATPase [Falsiroseomonas selenitidurans]
MAIPDSQAEAAALLRRLAGGGDPIETHISAIFIGADTVWKLKKAVRLGFLDFSDLAARAHFARRELALNQPHAPGLYRDVVPITRGPAGLALNGEGPPVEWVLRMAPVPPGDFLDAIARRGALAPALLDGMADAVAALHQAAPPAPPGFDAPGAAGRVLDGNIRDCLANGLAEARVRALGGAMRARLDALAPLLAARATAGRVRRCHGDLHLGNLCLWQGRPTPFDALEFDEALATTDTGYDLAFLLMDLCQFGQRAAANRVMNRYLGRSGDVGLLAPLGFWMALRAMVRAHVAARRGDDGMAYLAAAEGFLAPSPPRLVAIGGLQGTGKTWLARALAPDLGAAPGALHLRTDETRKRRAGLPPEARLPAEAYAEAESRAVHAEIFAAARQALAAGHSVVLDAVFLDPTLRAAAESAAAPHPFTGFWLAAPLDLLRERVARRSAEGTDASDATVAVLEQAARADPGAIGWQVLDATAPLTPARATLALHPGTGA